MAKCSAQSGTLAAGPLAKFDRATRGMALGEILVVLVIVGIAGSLVLASWIVYLRTGLPARVTMGAEVFPIAPTYAAFPAAVHLHALLRKNLAAARCVYVFGGDHLGLDAAAPARLRRPLAVNRLPELALSTGLPQDSASFYATYSSQLGREKSAAAPEDFTVLMLGAKSGVLAPLCLVQVEREDQVAGDGAAYVLHRVSLWDAEGSAERYAFAEPAGRRTCLSGAVHTWYRYGLDARPAEEGPALALFPDPWLWAGARAEPGEADPYSRFGYIFPLNP